MVSEEDFTVRCLRVNWSNQHQLALGGQWPDLKFRSALLTRTLMNKKIPIIVAVTCFIAFAGVAAVVQSGWTSTANPATARTALGVISGTEVTNTITAIASASFTNGQTLWVSAGSNAPAQKGRSDLPWGSITGAVAVATSGDTIKLRQGEVFNLRYGQIRLPKNVSLDYSDAVILSGSAAGAGSFQSHTAIVPGDNSKIIGYGGTLGCTNDYTDEFCNLWNAIGATTFALDGAFTNVYVAGGSITNATGDVFYVSQSEPNTKTYSLYAKDVNVVNAHWDVIALGGNTNSVFTFENCDFDIYGLFDNGGTFNGGYAAWLRWTSVGRLRLINCNFNITNAFYPTTYLVDIYSNLPPIQIIGGSYNSFGGELGFWHYSDAQRGISDASTNRIQWPPPNSVGYCSVNGAYMSFGSNIWGVYPATAADRISFWDNSANGMRYLDVGSGLQISGTTLSATATGSSGITNAYPTPWFKNGLVISNDASAASIAFYSVDDLGDPTLAGLSLNLADPLAPEYGWYFSNFRLNAPQGFKGDGSALTSVNGVSETYDPTGWNGDTGAATKNDVRDKIESLSLGGGGFFVENTATGSSWTNLYGDSFTSVRVLNVGLASINGASGGGIQSAGPVLLDGAQTHYIGDISGATDPGDFNLNNGTVNSLNVTTDAGVGGNVNVTGRVVGNGNSITNVKLSSIVSVTNTWGSQQVDFSPASGVEVTTNASGGITFLLAVANANPTNYNYKVFHVKANGGNRTVVAPTGWNSTRTAHIVTNGGMADFVVSCQIGQFTNLSQVDFTPAP